MADSAKINRAPGSFGLLCIAFSSSTRARLGRSAAWNIVASNNSDGGSEMSASQTEPSNCLARMKSPVLNISIAFDTSSCWAFKLSMCGRSNMLDVNSWANIARGGVQAVDRLTIKAAISQ